MTERITAAELRQMESYVSDSEIAGSVKPEWRMPGDAARQALRLVEDVRRLQGLLLNLADASGKVLGQDLAAIAQRYGVEAVDRLAPVLEEIKAIRAERQG